MDDWDELIALDEAKAKVEPAVKAAALVAKQLAGEGAPSDDPPAASWAERPPQQGAASHGAPTAGAEPAARPRTASGFEVQARQGAAQPLRRPAAMDTGAGSQVERFSGLHIKRATRRRPLPANSMARTIQYVRSRPTPAISLGAQESGDGQHCGR